MSPDAVRTRADCTAGETAAHPDFPTTFGQGALGMRRTPVLRPSID